jgi:integrase
VRANREKAILSAIWNYARESGFTALANPCAGVKGNKETGRDVYIEDDLLAGVYEHADQPLNDALDLFYLTAQRISDTLKMDDRHVRNDQLWIQQGKTGAKRRIEIVGKKVTPQNERLRNFFNNCGPKTNKGLPAITHVSP